MFIRSNQQLFLEPEVIEQTTLAHAGASRDAIQRNGGHADVSYQLQSGVQYPVARTRTAALRRLPLIRHLTSVPTGGSPRRPAWSGLLYHPDGTSNISRRQRSLIVTCLAELPNSLQTSSHSKSNPLIPGDDSSSKCLRISPARRSCALRVTSLRADERAQGA